MKFDYSNLPETLKKEKRWCLWKIIPGDPPKKMPINAFTGYGARSNDEKTWCDFDFAQSKIEEYKCDGLGFMLGNGFIGIDLDFHPCPEDDIVSLKSRFKEFSDNVIKYINSYTETSQSGNGYHIICRGEIPQGPRKKTHIEIYDEKRFFCMTGRVHLNKDVELRTEQVNKIWKKYVNEDGFKGTITNTETSQGYIFSGNSNNFSKTDQDIIRLASKSANGNLFNLLYNGIWENAYPSHSNADMALLMILAFWCAKDFDQMDRIFRGSKLYRDKWDEMRGEKTYGEISIINACNKTTKVFGQDYAPQEKPKTFNTSKAKKYELDDTGNAIRFYDTYGDFLHFNSDNDNWLFFNEKYWQNDDSEHIKTYVDEMMDEMRQEAFDQEGIEATKILLKNVKHLASNSGKNAMIKELKHIGNIPTANKNYDTQKNLLNCPNGVVDLKTGKLYAHDKKYLMTRTTSVDCDLENEPTKWIKTITEIFGNDLTVVDFMQKALGYSLTGYTKEQCLFECVGVGSNGKSLFMNTISKILGTYALNMEIESLLFKAPTSASNASSDLARIKGSRFIRTNEPNKGSRFNEGLIKRLTGNDPLTARFLYGKEFEFISEAKIWIACNEKIEIRGTDKGIWRRMRLIEFNQCFEGEKNDKNLEETLETEYSQILGWLVKGAYKYFKEGLELPESILKSTKSYQVEMDKVETFINECVKEKPNGRAKASDVYSEYKTWAKQSNEWAMSQTKFGIEMGKKYKKERYGGVVYYVGFILLKDDDCYTYL